MSSETKELVELSLIEQVAVLVLRRRSERDIAKELGLTHKQVYLIKQKDEFTKTLKRIAEEKTRDLLYSWKKRMEEADKHVWEAFMYQVKEKKSMEAVKEYLNMIGFKAREDRAEEAPVVTLIMPGAVVPEAAPIIDVTPKKVEE